jgi:hypothetical protein
MRNKVVNGGGGGGKTHNRARTVRKADNLAAICEPIVYTMWNPQHLTTLQASTV